MKSILMITPENIEMHRFKAHQNNNFTQLTMPYLAGFIPDDYLIRLVDEYTESIPFERFDLVAITVNTPNAPYVYQIAEKFQRLGCWVVMGGPHVTLCPEEAIGHADTLVIGEAEDTWPRFLEDVLLGRPQKSYSTETPPHLRNLPIPRRDLIIGHKFTSGSVIASRGCPHNCSYCCLKKIYHQEFRTRPIEDVILDIKSMSNQYFVFWDDNFFAEPTYTKTLLKKLVPLKKKWAAQVTAHSCLDDELLSIAKEAGCLYLFLGIESFSELGLREANKGINHINQYGLIVSKLHEHGISVQVGIVFGFDSDTIEVFETTLQGCRTIGVDGVTVSVLSPFPGTPLYDQYKAENRLLPVDWSYFDSKTKVSFVPKNMTVAELFEGYNKFRGKFYSWKNIFTRLRKTRANRFYNFVMNLGYKRAYERYHD